jgi:outer membrane immunogenic protein
MKKILAFAAAALIAGAASAHAAEFDGPYAGLSLGLDKSNFNTEANNKDDFSASGVDVGLFGGYQKSYGNYIIGGEAAVEKSYAGYNEHGVKLDHEWSYSLKARPGYKINPATAVFGSAGVTWGTFKFNDGVEKTTPTKFGYTVGAGVESYVSEKISLRADYEHGFYGSFHGDGVKVTPDTDTVKAGVAYHF